MFLRHYLGIISAEFILFMYISRMYIMASLCELYR